MQLADLESWLFVLRHESETHRSNFIAAVVSTALPEAERDENVSVAVRAFIEAKLPQDLICVLEKLIIEKQSPFRDNADLQNLLLLTAIKSDVTRVPRYIESLNAFNGVEIARYCFSRELYEEAYMIYVKFEMPLEAVGVLVEQIDDLERAVAFASDRDSADVWSRVARGQLERELVREAVESFLRAADPSMYSDVIETVGRVVEGMDRDTEADEIRILYEDLIRFLTMAREKVREAYVDSELMYAYAITDRLDELQAFHSSAGSHVGQTVNVAERCFSEKMFMAARILFEAGKNYRRLTMAQLALGEYALAVEAARKANSLRVWREVTLQCIAAREFRLAQTAALNVVIVADELERIVAMYSEGGHFEELLTLLEEGTVHERCHNALFTELVIQYSRHKPSKLMSYLNSYRQRINVPKAIRACTEAMLWKEVTFLYRHYNEFDNAVRCMIEHPGDAWEDNVFRETLVRVANTEVIYKGIRFYVDMHPTLVSELLDVVNSKVVHQRVVTILKKMKKLPLIKDYLVRVQSLNIAEVNDALNGLYVEEENVEALRVSILTYDNLDAVGLASKLKAHESLEMRRIASFLYMTCGKYEEAVELSKHDKLYRDAIDSAAASGSAKVADDLLRYFVSEECVSGRKECFAACLYSCYNLLEPAKVMELAWRNGLNDVAMPFMIQSMSDLSDRVKTLEGMQETMREKHDAVANVVQAAVVPRQVTGQMTGVPVHMTGVPVQMTGQIMPGNPVMMAQPQGFR